MKKVLLTLLMLMMVVGLFAADTDQVKITAHIDGETNVRFTNAAFGKTGTLAELTSAGAPSDTEVNPVSDNAPDRTASFWVSAHTTASTKVSLDVYGSALTLITTPASEGTNATYGNKTIPLKVSLVSSEGDTNTYNYLVAEESSSSITLNASVPDCDSNTALTLTESGETSSTRGLTGQISVEVENKETEAPAGDYEAFIYLAVSNEG